MTYPLWRFSQLRCQQSRKKVNNDGFPKLQGHPHYRGVEFMFQITEGRVFCQVWSEMNGCCCFFFIISTAKFLSYYFFKEGILLRGFLWLQAGNVNENKHLRVCRVMQFSVLNQLGRSEFVWAFGESWRKTKRNISAHITYWKRIVDKRKGGVQRSDWIWMPLHCVRLILAVGFTKA